jgi:AraC-like DNA-binding protein
MAKLLPTNQPRNTPRRIVTDWRVIHVLKLIKDSVDLDRKLPRVSELASEMHLSRSRLEHLFKEQTGLAMKQCLKGLFLRKAARLLSHGVLTVKEVAFESGYRCPVNLSQDFEKWFGASPSHSRIAHFTKK